MTAAINSSGSVIEVSLSLSLSLALSLPFSLGLSLALALSLARSLSLARALSLLLHAILFFLARYTIFEGQDVSIDTTCIPVQFTCNNVHVNIYAHMYVCV